MLSIIRATPRAAIRSSRQQQVAGPMRRQISSFATPAPRHVARAALVAFGMTSVAAVCLLKPELAPSVMPTLHADEQPSPNCYVDPTSSTPFPVTLDAPNGRKLKLVGTGVRTVSFLGIRVYAGGFYVEETMLRRLTTIEGFEPASYSPDKLLPPFDKKEGLYGEKLMSKLIESGDAAIVIIPLRSTNLPHLRDGFARGLMARLKLPHVTSSMSDEESEAAATALTEMKGFFPSRSLPKGSPLELYYDASRKTVMFQMRPKPDAPHEQLGTLTHPVLARELLLSYFSDTLETSPELRKSVAHGLAGEPRTAAVPVPAVA